MFSKMASIAAYIRQHGCCRHCKVPVALNYGFFYDTIPQNDSYWIKVYKTPGRAALAYRLGSRAIMSCICCAPDGAELRVSPLKPPSEIRAIGGIPDVSAYAISNYWRLTSKAYTETEKKEEYARFINTGGTASEARFKMLIWSRFRQASSEQRARMQARSTSSKEEHCGASRSCQPEH